MHVPDGFLTNRVAFSLDVLSGATILYASRRLKLELSARVIPIMGVLSAFVFAAQMLNFPVFGGTSGHLVGGALLGIVLGPMAGFLTMATVIIAQAFFLQDGGLVALGANLFNIAAIPVFSGYFLFRFLGSPDMPGKRLPITGFVAGWVSVVLAAAACAIQLDLSGAIPLKLGLPSMTGYHAVIGVVEGLLTAGVLSFLARVRPDLLKREFSPALGILDWAGGIVLVAIPLGILVLAGSSRLPDPLEALLEPTPVAAGIQERLLLSERTTDLYRFLVYLGLLTICVVAFILARMVTTRRGRP